jgi:hypothetical protein
MWSLIGLGAVLAVGAMAALGSRQPFAVWFPLILISTLLLSVIPGRLAQIRRQYEETELRRMASIDALNA